MFLDGLSAEARELLLGVAEPVSFVRGATLYQHGEVADGAYLLRDGVAKASIVAPGGDLFEVGFYSAGDLLGEIALVSSGTRSATVTAETLLDGWHVSRDDFRALVAQRGVAAMVLQHGLALSLARRLAGAASRAARLASGSDLPAREPLTADPLRNVPRSRRPPFDVSGFLPKLPFFEGFSATDIDHVVSAGRYLDLPRGGVLVSPGMASESVLLVLRGAMEMLRPVTDGCRRVAVLGPGQPLGVTSHLLASPHTGWVLAREASLLLEWPSTSFQEMLLSDTAPGNRLRRATHRYLAAAIDRANREIARLAVPTAAA